MVASPCFLAELGREGTGCVSPQVGAGRRTAPWSARLPHQLKRCGPSPRIYSGLCQTHRGGCFSRIRLGWGKPLWKAVLPQTPFLKLPCFFGLLRSSASLRESSCCPAPTGETRQLRGTGVLRVLLREWPVAPQVGRQEQKALGGAPDPSFPMGAARLSGPRCASGKRFRLRQEPELVAPRVPGPRVSNRGPGRQVDREEGRVRPQHSKDRLTPAHADGVSQLRRSRSNVQHRTLNIEHRMREVVSHFVQWTLNVRCWTFDVEVSAQVATVAIGVRGCLLC